MTGSIGKFRMCRCCSIVVDVLQLQAVYKNHVYVYHSLYLPLHKCVSRCTLIFSRSLMKILSVNEGKVASTPCEMFILS